MACLGLIAINASGWAQYPPPYPYYPGYNSGFGPGNTLNGAANVISAAGGQFIDQEKARVTREQANQAKIDTKRKTFDEMMYEKANTPNFAETQEKSDMAQIRRILNHPLQAEVTSGKAQNILLPYVDKLLRVGVQGPPVPIDQTMLKSINVTTGQLSADIGLFKDGGKLNWPIGLRGPAQKKLDPLFPPLVSSAIAGDLDVDLYNKANKGIAALKSELKQKFNTDQIDGNLYLQGKKYLESLDSSMRMLTEPSATKLLNGTYAATGRSVPELVYNMMSKGLRFAPANPGVEAPYYALQNALSSFAAGAESSSGFRATFDPLVQAPKKDFSK
jgi:hypothetical protein